MANTFKTWLKTHHLSNIGSENLKYLWPTDATTLAQWQSV